MPKTRPAGGTFAWTEVGEKIIVWSPGGQKPGASSRNACVISSHGDSAALINSPLQIKTPSIRLIWYGPHGQVLNDPGVGKLTRGTVHPYGDPTVITGSGSLAQNYELTKYQGAKHQGSRSAPLVEDYEMISRGMHPEFVARLKEEGHTHIYNEDILLQDADLDVVTIRYRRMKKAPTLYGVINELHKNGWLYTDFHCAFCRGGGTPFDAPDA